MITSSNQASGGVFSCENESSGFPEKKLHEMPNFSVEMTYSEETKNQAEKIIEKFGNARKLADALCRIGYKINRSSVYRWTYSGPDGGTGGIIPTVVWPYLLKAARLEGVYLSPKEFDPREVTKETRAKNLVNSETGEKIRYNYAARKDMEAEARKKANIKAAKERRRLKKLEAKKKK